MISSEGGVSRWPRLPLEGSLDLTYRCNDACRHCWLRLRVDAQERQDELSFNEVRRIADEARALGCRRWAISGGEPMLRPDFADIFEYLTARCAGYSLNTNGTLITPAIARLLARKGNKMVALYGATAEVHDHITRTPGSFEAAMRGFAYLKEAGAGFTVQIIPMRASWHQYDDMVKLARSLSPDYRVGAAWLNLSACGSSERNAEIMRQRLDPTSVVALDPPELSCAMAEAVSSGCGSARAGDDRLFASCIENRNAFHIDPYGGLSFCSYVKDPALRFDLRRGSFEEGWETFLPSLVDQARGGPEYLEGCGACDLRSDCRWCGAHAYLEHRRSGAKVDYLCEVARAAQSWKSDRERNHRRHFGIAGVTVRVESDLPFANGTFAAKFDSFALDRTGGDVITIRHHFALPDLTGRDIGRQVYRRPPWAVHRTRSGWVYQGISMVADDPSLFKLAEFNHDHTRGRIFHPSEAAFRKGGLDALTTFPTDQILLARVLADRRACYLHSSAVVVDGAGLLFVGHSEAGKSTTVKLLRGQTQILCDDRNIVRRWPEGFRVHGTWSHGEIAEVSSASAPLAAILLLRKSDENRLVRIDDARLARNELLGCVIKPLVDQGWWEKTLDLVHTLSREVPCYEMRFDKSGAIVPALLALARGNGGGDLQGEDAPPPR